MLRLNKHMNQKKSKAPRTGWRWIFFDIIYYAIPMTAAH